MNRKASFIVHRSSFIVLFAVACAKAPVPAPVPRRVVSLAPNITEIIFAIGGGGTGGGKEEFSPFSFAAEGISPGGGGEAELEQVSPPHPDLLVGEYSH